MLVTYREVIKPIVDQCDPTNTRSIETTVNQTPLRDINKTVSLQTSNIQKFLCVDSTENLITDVQTNVWMEMEVDYTSNTVFTIA